MSLSSSWFTIPSFGLVLNNPITGVVLKDVLPDDLTIDTPILSGGPVEPMTLQYLHQTNVDDALVLSPDISLGGDFNQVKRLLNLGQISTHDIKFFLGYSGWGEGQLKDEIDSDSWLVADFKREDKKVIFKEMTLLKVVGKKKKIEKLLIQ